MEILTLSVIMGAILGLLVVDIKQRISDRSRLLEAETKATEAAKVLSDLHNKQIDQLKAINDKVNAHEMLIKTNTMSDNNRVIKRF